MASEEQETPASHGVEDAEAALDRLQAAGYTIFRNGRVLTPKGHATTPEEQADFDIARSVYRYSKLI